MRSLAIQWRVIHALVMREVITRYGREGLGVLWFFLEPLLFTVASHTIVVFFELTQRHRFSGRRFCLHRIFRLAALAQWRKPRRYGSCAKPGADDAPQCQVARCLHGAHIPRVGGGYRRVSSARRGPDGYRRHRPSRRCGPMLVGWLLMAWFSLGLGLVVGALSAIFGVFEKLWRPMSYPLFMISGAFFMVDWLPASVRELAPVGAHGARQ